MSQISFHTLGCKLNQAETEELKNDLQKAGFEVVPFGEKSDVAVIRACAVTCGASQTTRETIRRAKRVGAYTVVIGCLENKELPEIDFVGKNNEEVKNHLIKKFHPQTKDKNSNIKHNRTRAFIKIQTGCAFNCAYCIIPAYRGKSQSIPAQEIIKKIKNAEKSEYKEVVLTGVNICLYKDEKTDLSGLLQKIINETSIPRIRLGSLDPRLISKELISLYTGSMLRASNFRLLPHWHLSLQSGSDKILRVMNRNYTTKNYLNIIKKLRAANYLFSITTDIIVGFPEETDRDFLATCNLVKKIGFANVHIFPYSPRPGTAAFDFKNTVHDKIKTERAKILKQTSEIVTLNYFKKLVGHIRPVLFEQKKDGVWRGYSPEYIEIKFKSNKNLRGKIKKIKIRQGS